MIFARDKSQMCNNLLQYAHVYAWGREHGRKVISMRFSYKYQFFKICHTSLTSFPLYLFAKYMAAIKLLPTASFKHEDCNRAKLEKKMLRHKNIVVSGWNVRFYDLFIKYIDEIRDLFTPDEIYRTPVMAKFKETEGDDSVIRLGVHIRRGDYKEWQYGKYYFEDEVYCNYIKRFCSLFSNKTVHIYLSSNDPELDVEKYRQLSGIQTIHNFKGSAPEDLFMLSQCDYVIGPPSTFSVVATMYHDHLLYRMDNANAEEMTKYGFKDFNYWFRRLI